METLRNKVIAKLIKLGNNVQEVNEMVDLHFETATSKYSKVNDIAYFIHFETATSKYSKVNYIAYFIRVVY